METVECEVALTSAAIPAPMVLDLASNPVATLQVNLHSGLAQVISPQLPSLCTAIMLTSPPLYPWYTQSIACVF